MMKRITYLAVGLCLFLTQCKEDEKVFEKSAAQRSEEAIAELKNKLVDGPWKVKYKPEDGSGEYWVIMDFKTSGEVTMKTDLDADDGAYYDQTNTYRIDSSLGLELIIESYSFFSYLFELDQASFGAEYEFNFVNTTPDGELVFTSKTDTSIPTILVFEKASASDDDLLAVDLAKNLNTMKDDLSRFSSSYKMTYTNKDLALFLSLNELRRVVQINSGSRKSNPANSEFLSFSSGYRLQGDSLIFLEPFSDNVTGITVSIKGIKLNGLTDSDVSVCESPTAIHLYDGKTSANDAVVFEPSIVDATGARFIAEGTFFYCPLEYLFFDGDSQYQEAVDAIGGGVLSMQLYWSDAGDFHALGFVTRNSSGALSFVLKHFEPVVTNNQITFNFEDDFTIYDAENEGNLDAMDYYLQQLTEGGTTFVYNYADDIYEFNNPCTGVSYIFINGN